MIDHAIQPCPFCQSTHVELRAHISWYVYCLACKTMGPCAPAQYGTTPEQEKAEAVRLWNRRPGVMRAQEDQVMPTVFNTTRMT